MNNILVLGGTGFLGRQVCELLQRAGLRFTVVTRHPKNASWVQPLPLATVVHADIHHPATLAQLVHGHDAVVNLVAILHGSEAAFERVHVTLPAQLAQACQAAGVKRVVHVSALGADEHGPSRYQRSKARGEAVLRAAGLDLTVIRPSVMFGAGDRFLNLFVRLLRVLPVLPLAGASTRFQAVWVEDVARAVVHALTHPNTAGQTVEAVGPQVMTLAELVRLAGRTAGCAKPVVGLPRALAYFQALALELVPGEPLMSTDNLSSLEVDNVASPAAAGLLQLRDWGLVPAAVSSVLPSYLGADSGGEGPRSHLLALRSRGA